jgi:hypothetical protein
MNDTNAKMSGWDRVTLWLLFLILSTDIVSGAIRYYAALGGVAWLTYVPHVIMLIATLVGMSYWPIAEGVTGAWWSILALFCVAGFWGLINITNPSQVGFGFWMLISIPYGMVVAPAVTRNWGRLKPYLLACWAVTIAGVFIGEFVRFPWVGFAFQLAGERISASHERYTGGIRLQSAAGLSTGSVHAASLIAILALCVIISCGKKLAVTTWFLSLLAIVLTTSKSTIGAYLLVSIIILVGDRLRNTFRFAPVVLGTLTAVVVPTVALVRQNQDRILDWRHSAHAHSLAAVMAGQASFSDRWQVTWPGAIMMIMDRGSAILGRGFGGIGRPQFYFEKATYNPADNLGIYLYGVFGVLGILWLLWLALLPAGSVINTQYLKFLFLALCLIFVQGVGCSSCEVLVFNFVLGMSARSLSSGVEVV